MRATHIRSHVRASTGKEWPAANAEERARRRTRHLGHDLVSHWVQRGGLDFDNDGMSSQRREWAVILEFQHIFGFASVAVGPGAHHFREG